MQSKQNQEESIEWQSGFKQWAISCGWTLCYSCAISAFIIIPLNGMAHVLGAGINLQ